MLTSFLVWPILLACIMPPFIFKITTILAYLVIILIACLMTAIIALFCSIVFRKSSTSMMAAYLIIIVLFCVPVAVGYFADSFFADHPSTQYVKLSGMASPFAAAFSVPLDAKSEKDDAPKKNPPSWTMLAYYVGFCSSLIVLLTSTMIWLFNSRWRVAT